jgi:hypothetical protein
MILKIDAPLAATNVRKPAQGMAWRVPPSTPSFGHRSSAAEKRSAKTAFLLSLDYHLLLAAIEIRVAAIEIQVSHNRNSSNACGTAVFVNERLLLLF